MNNTNRHILTLSCPDVRGIVASVTGFLAENGCFIIESAQFGDASTCQFFMRVEFAMEPTAPAIDEFKKKFSAVADKFKMRWQVADKAKKSRVVILVSKYSHCLYDLLHRWEAGSLPIEIPAVISNHEDLRRVVEFHKIPFYYFPTGDKVAQEKQILDVIEKQAADAVVLARYMQILSPQMCARLSGMAINIHHSFLPSFKGAKPYQQAFNHGVKLIGATAHYVTTDLDEGPIIEQEVARVDHTFDIDDLTATGRDIECQVLARALKYHVEHRVLLNDKKTVVFK